jgi:hypothetical protein
VITVDDALSPDVLGGHDIHRHPKPRKVVILLAFHISMDRFPLDPLDQIANDLPFPVFVCRLIF